MIKKKKNTVLAYNTYIVLVKRELNNFKEIFNERGI